MKFREYRCPGRDQILRHSKMEYLLMIKVAFSEIWKDKAVST